MYRISLLFASTLMLTSMAFGQLKQLHHPSSMTARHPEHSALKIADHEDYPLEYYEYNWNDNSASWDSSGHATKAYFSNGNLAEIQFEQFNGVSFVPSYRAMMTYNAQNLEEATTVYSWNGSNWVDNYRDEYTYDQYGTQTFQVELQWTGSSWDTVFKERITNTYVFTDKLSRQVVEDWTNTSGVWENVYIDEYSWPTSAFWDTETYSEWDGSIYQPLAKYTDVKWHNFADYKPSRYTSQEYNGSSWDIVGFDTLDYGINDSYVQYSLEWNGASFDSTSKMVNEVDAHDHTTLSEYFSYNGGWNFTYGNRSSYTYDGQGITTEIVFENNPDTAYALDFKIVFSSFFTGTENLVVPKIQVSTYPNPCADRLHFTLDQAGSGPVEVALYDLQGKLRLTSSSRSQVQGAIEIPVSSALENGTYLYRLSTKAGVAQGKVVVQR